MIRERITRVQVISGDQLETLAAFTGMSQESVLACLDTVVESYQMYLDGPCHCPRLPWTPHKHRYEMTTRGDRWSA